MADGIVALHQSLRAFFTLIFGQQDGHIVFATIDRAKKQESAEYFRQFFYLYPDELDDAFIDVIEQYGRTHDTYFCAQLIEKKKAGRVKSNIKLLSTIWADLDTCPLSSLLLKPTLTIETSPGRHQAFWRLDEPVPAEQGEELARRIAYYHVHEGCDNGWGLTKLLRVPYTPNHKYGEDPSEKPIVLPVDAYTSKNTFYIPGDFDVYPPADMLKSRNAGSKTPPPVAVGNGWQILTENYAGQVDDFTLDLFEHEPDDEVIRNALELNGKADWSAVLHALEMQLFESPGLSIEEVFAVCLDAACNKFRRDKWRRDPVLNLWEDVQRAYEKHQEHVREKLRERPEDFPPTPKPGDTPDAAAPEDEFALLSPEESARAARDFTFIDKYKAQLTKVTDAPADFHVAAAFMLLSFFCAQKILIKFAHAPRGVRPLLWFMVLAPPATRKSTAYNHARDFLRLIDPNHPQISLTSPEGFIEELAHHEGYPIIYTVDEVQDNLFHRVRKDHMQEFFGTLSNAYDGSRIRKTLKRAEYDIQEPLVISYCTGILKTTLERMADTDVFAKGLGQRFLYVVNDQPSSLETRRRLAPATGEQQGIISGVENELHALQERYLGPTTYDVIFDPVVGDRMGAMDDILAKEARKAPTEYVEQEWASTFERLSQHIVRAAVLIASSRVNNPVDGAVLVSEDDMLKALWFGEQWRYAARIVLAEIGRPPYERLVQRAIQVIKDHGAYGCTRQKLYNELTLRGTDGHDVVETLEYRGLIVIDFTKKPRKRSDFKPEFRPPTAPKDRIRLTESVE